MIEDSRVRGELEDILRSHYSSLMIVSEREKLAEFGFPLLVILEGVHEVVETRSLHLPPGTQFLVLACEGDSESMSAAFEAGAADFLPHPFNVEEIIRKIESHLEAFRKPLLSRAE